MSPRPSANQAHIPALDGLRGVAVLLAMLPHLSLLPSDRGPWIDRLLWRVSHSSWCGVDLFFVLSGFLITGILLDSREHPHCLRNFYARRLLRIFPLYYALLLLLLVLLPALGRMPFPQAPWSIAHRPLFFLYLQNYFPAFALDSPVPLTVTWSLAVEEQFYLLWPWLILLLGHRARRLLTVLLLLLLGSALLRVLLRGALPPKLIYMMTPLRLDGLIGGSALALLARRSPGGLRRFRRQAGHALLGAALVLLGVVWREGHLDYLGALTQGVGYPALAVLFAALLLLSVSAPPGHALQRALAHPALQLFGRYSYAMYLMHALCAEVLLARVAPRLPVLWGSRAPAQLLFFALAIATTTAVAHLSYRFFEQPILRLRRFFPR